MENSLVLSSQEVRRQVNLIQEIMSNVMQEGQHYGEIPGCGNKPTLLKSGAEKLSLTFRLRPIIDNANDIVVDNLENGHREIRVYCHILNMDGVELATGIGSCSTMESKYRYRGGEKKPTGRPVPTEYWNLKKAGNMAEAKKLLGGDGFGVAKIDGRWEICEIGEKMENPDIADSFNTVLKMAKKRAYVDGILSSTGASDIFTQDIEDMPHLRKNENGSAPTESSSKPEVEMPQSKSANGNGEVISEAQRKRLYVIAMTAGMTKDHYKEWLLFNFEIENARDIKKSQYQEICQKAEIWKSV